MCDRGIQGLHCCMPTGQLAAGCARSSLLMGLLTCLSCPYCLHLVLLFRREELGLTCFCARWDDTVGHSQLESEVLNAADPDSPTPPLAPVSPPDLHTDPERISPGEALGSDSDEDDRPANLASAAAAVISGRGKRRQVGSANGATKDAARVCTACSYYVLSCMCSLVVVLPVLSIADMLYNMPSGCSLA